MYTEKRPAPGPVGWRSRSPVPWPIAVGKKDMMFSTTDMIEAVHDVATTGPVDGGKGTIRID